MSNFKFFAKYKKDCKTLSQVVNKFDFNGLVTDLLNEGCKGNFSIFDDVLSKNTRYSFLMYCLDNVVVNKGRYNKDNMSDLKLVNLISTLFDMSELECTQVQERDFYNKEEKKMYYKTFLQPSLLGLKRDWLMSKVVSNVIPMLEETTLQNEAKIDTFIEDVIVIS